MINRQAIARQWWEDAAVTPPPPVYDADYQAILDRATTLGYTLPTLSQRSIQNQLVLDLKAGSNWTVLRVLYVPANDGSSDFSTINWKDPANYQMTKVNSPTWTTNKGFSSGASQLGYLTMNWVPSTDGGVYTQNAASIGAYMFAGSGDVAATGAVIGATSGTSNILLYDQPATNVMGRMNSSNVNISYGATNPNINNRSLYSLVRTASNALQTFVGGTQQTSGTTASTALVGISPYLLARNNAGVKDFPAPSAWQLSVMYAGGTGGTIGTFSTAIETYITAINP